MTPYGYSNYQKNEFENGTFYNSSHENDIELKSHLDYSSEPQSAGFNVSGIIQRVSGVLAQQDCAEFAQTVLNAISSRRNPALGSLAGVFKAFVAQGDDHDLFSRKAPPGSWGYASPTGSIAGGDAAIYAQDLKTTPEVQLGYDADSTIAELFHLAGRNKSYTDEQLAKAVHASNYATEADSVIDPTTNIFDNRYNARGWKNHQAYSVYFHYIQMLHCTAVPQPPGHPRRIG